jgi:hypothetical protein
VPPGTGLGNKDILAIRIFLREFVVQSLIPYVERNVQQWNEQVRIVRHNVLIGAHNTVPQLAASRRGITGRLFTASRRYFGSRPASPAPGGPPAYNPARGLYPFQAQEAQTRRLADFAFMIHDYKLAISTYDLVRKDNMTDKAWRDYASATVRSASTVRL